MERQTDMGKGHCKYISFEDFENNRQQSQMNKTNSVKNPLGGPPREGMTLLQGDDNKTIEALNSKGILSATGKTFTKDMIEWIRYKYKIDKPLLRAEHEFTVPEVVREMFNVSKHMVYYWISRKYVPIRRTEKCILIEINPVRQLELRQIIDNSYKANSRLVKA